MGRNSRPKRGGSKHNQRATDLTEAMRGLPRAKCLAPDKVPYQSRKQAESAAEKQWQADGGILSPYICGDHFHLTSKHHTQPKQRNA